LENTWSRALEEDLRVTKYVSDWSSGVSVEFVGRHLTIRNNSLMIYNRTKSRSHDLLVLFLSFDIKLRALSCALSPHPLDLDSPPYRHENWVGEIDTSGSGFCILCVQLSALSVPSLYDMQHFGSHDVSFGICTWTADW
jgi:hypothetical protein